MRKNESEEREMIAVLSRQIGTVVDASGATQGCQAIATIITAARYARRADMLIEYIRRGEPI
jgi:hypothetical protein